MGQKIKRELLRFEDQIFESKKIRRNLGCGDHNWFFHIYLRHYIKYPTANFQKEILYLSQNTENRLLAIVAFRGSAKSTIMTLSYPIWSIIGKPKKKYILIVCQTQQQAQQALENIKTELESNRLLISDFGRFNFSKGEWSEESIVLTNYQARISVISINQSVRGLRHCQYRPDLIICDDIEDLQLAKNKEGRDKLWQFVNSELIPMGNIDTKTVFVGNLVHEDSVMVRLKNAIEKENIDGIFKSYPLLDANGNALWSGKFPTSKEIENLRSKIFSLAAWEREYMLRILPDEDQIIKSEFIHYYDELPKNQEPRLAIVGTDLAISIKNNADYTAIILALVYGFGSDIRIYILPNSINKRMDFTETIKEIKKVYESFNYNNKQVYIEKVGYQDALTQQLNIEGCPATAVSLNGKDKFNRLNLTSNYIHEGKILFPRFGAEQLILQLTKFGVERFDDLVDAFTLIINKVIADNTRSIGKNIVSSGGQSIFDPNHKDEEDELIGW